MNGAPPACSAEIAWAELARSEPDAGLRLRRRRHARLHQAQLKEDIVGATPDRVERVRICRALPKELRDLRRDGYRGARGWRRGDAGQAGHARATLRVVGSALVRGGHGEAVICAEYLCPHRAWIRREQSGARRQHGLVGTRVGQAVTEVVDIGELGSCRPGCGECEHDSAREHASLELAHDLGSPWKGSWLSATAGVNREPTILTEIVCGPAVRKAAGSTRRGGSGTRPGPDIPLGGDPAVK